MRFSSMKTMRFSLLAILPVFVFSGEAFAAVRAGEPVRQSQSATRDTQERAARARAAEEQLTGSSGTGSSGRGSDLAAISSPKKATTFTGFPAGTLPGDGATQPEGDPKSPQLVAMSGDPLLGPISDAHLGQSLDKIAVIADHVGYRLVMRPTYRPRSLLEPPYSYYLMKGRRRIKTLYFDRQLKLALLR